MSAVERLDAIDARTAATSGPGWFVAAVGSHVDDGGERFEIEVQRFQLPDDHDLVATLGLGGYSEESTPNAEFIAHARQDVPAMATALRAILNLHTPGQQRVGPPICAGCSTELATYLHPCATVQIIEKELAR